MRSPSPREDICIVIPCFNEALRISRVVSGAREFAQTVLVVDDGSADATADAARQAGAMVESLPRNCGKGVALKHGFAWAAAHGFQAALTLDGDGQHDTSEIPIFFEAFDRGDCDLVIGNRMTDTRAMPRLRRWTNRFTSAAISRLAGQRLSDTQCGFRLIGLDFWKKINLESRRYEMESELLIRASLAGARISQVVVRTIYFKSGTSKINPLTDTLRFMRLYWRIKFKN